MVIQRIKDEFHGEHRGKSAKKDWKFNEERRQQEKVWKDLTQWLQSIYWLMVFIALLLLGLVIRIFTA
jgi:cytoskeletal protein RodZ